MYVFHFFQRNKSSSNPENWVLKMMPTEFSEDFFTQVVKKHRKGWFFRDASKVDLNIVKLLIFSLFPGSPSRPLKDYFLREFKNHPKLGLLLF